VNAQDWQEVKSRFHQALLEPPETRQAFLTRVCLSDVIRAEVERLLIEYDQAGDFLSQPAVAHGNFKESNVQQIAGDLLANSLAIQVADGVNRIEDNQAVGPYRLLHQIGEGGMGKVWLAEQTHPVRRRVALKLIRAGMDTREVVARFESERQALALMDHPAIAKVFYAGSTTSGLPYFVMEYVPGMPITEWCDKYKLTVRERLELFIQVCEGVKHAHEKAIIHRDLKPSNILVTELDGKAVPKIIDFGVAKAVSQKLTQDTLRTGVGLILGTPEYMSPEQANSMGEDIDTRTDVYSLGIILYQLLAGVMPIDLKQMTLEEMLRKLREDDPPRPSTKLRMLGELTTMVCLNRASEPRALARQLQGDLDSIALKALEKRRAQRYGSPSELALEIRRYLRHEPVMARPQSYWYRTWKFARRYRWAVTGAVSVGLSLLIGLSAALWEAHLAQRQARVAETAARTSAAVQEFITDIFDTNSRDQKDTLLARQTTARQLLDIGAQKIDSELNDAPAAKGKMLEILANLYLGMGLDDQAVALSRKRVAVAKMLYGANDDKVAEALCDLAACMEASRFVNEREATLLEAKRILDRNGNSSSLARGELLRNLAKHYKNSDQRKALDYASQAVAFYRKAPLSIKLPQALYDQAVSYALFRDYSKAEALAAESVSIARNLGGPAAADLPAFEELLAELNVRLLHYDAAKQNFELAFQSAKNLNGAEHVDTMETEVGLGDYYSRISDNRDALRRLKHALDICLKLRGPNDPFHTPQVLTSYAAALSSSGQFEDGLAAISQAVENRRKNGPPNRLLGQAIYWQASILADLGEYEKARLCLDEAEAMSRTVGFKLQSEYAVARLKLAFDLKKPDQASIIIDSFYGPLPEHPSLSLELLSNLSARVQLALARSDAEEALRLANRLSAEIVESPNRKYLKLWEERAALAEGQAYLLQHRASKAVLSLEHARQLDEEMYEFPSAELIPSCTALALAYFQTGNRAESLKLLTEAESIHKSHPHLAERFEAPLRELRRKQG